MGRKKALVLHVGFGLHASTSILSSSACCAMFVVESHQQVKRVDFALGLLARKPLATAKAGWKLMPGLE